MAMSGHLHLVTGGDRGHLAQPRLSIRIVLAEDHIAVRRNLKALLDREEGMTVVSEAADLQTAERNVHADRPNVLVLDLEMPGGSSLEAVARLRCLAPDTEIVVLTMERSPILARRALEPVPPVSCSRTGPTTNCLRQSGRRRPAESTSAPASPTAWMRSAGAPAGGG